MGKRQEVGNESVAVIGSGISGLATALALAMRGSRKVTVFEAEEVCGGHTLTDATSEPGVPIDLGFQVFNLTTYPHLQGMFEMLGIDSEPSEMSFSLSVDGGALEWGSNSLFAQKSNAVSPRFLKMLVEVLRFGREAPKVLQEEQHAGMSLGEYLEKHRYSESFKSDYLLPMCAAVWSVPSRQVLAFPVQMLIRFWVNHHLLDVMGRPCWRVVKGRSKSYVEEILKRLKVCGASVRIGAKVVGVERCKGRLVVSYNETRRGRTSETLMDTFDEVVLATHSDVSLEILSKGGGFSEMTEVLANIPYSYNDVYLHTDPSLMPTRRDAWASWNCVEARSGAGGGVRRAGSSDASGSSSGSTSGSSSDASESSGSAADDSLDAPVCVTYWANRLQDLSNATKDYFVTLNPVHAPQPTTVLRKMVLSHPIFGEASMEAQRRIASLQGRHGVYLCGAWCGYGFHEDGIRSAVAVLEAMQCPLPWTPSPVCSPKIGVIDTIAIKLFDKFARKAVAVGRLRLILPNGEELVYGTPAPPTGGEAEAWRDRPPLNATVRIYDVSFFRKIITRHDTGLGESYMDGDFEVIEGLSGSGDLGSLMAVITANAHSLEANRGIMGVFNMIGDTLLTWAHARRSNTAAGSRRNIEEHYDAGNLMYKAFLDETMTYSCGIWRNDAGGGGNRGECTDTKVVPSLQEAQLNKLDALIRKADIREGHKVLEIGCGWGSFAMRAASTTGCHVVGLTLSREQLAEATQRVKDAGLEDKVTLLYCDYRDTPDLGSYDRVVSCEMIEAVGHEHLPAYFATIGAALKPGGKCAIQVIAAPDYRYDEYCGSSDFIREHIFPGGHLPSMGACVEAARGTGLSVHGSDDIGEDYAVTLRKWRQAWEAKKDYIISKLGYSERFWKKYRFYFVYCEAGFDAKYIHTFQVTWIKDGEFTLSDAQLQEALELSKGGNVNRSTGRRKSSLGWAVSTTLSTIASVCSALSSFVWNNITDSSKIKAT